MNFSSPDKIESCISNMRSVEVLRAQQRALLNDYYNGKAPFTDQEAKDNQILVNYNDKSGATILHQARAQYENAMLKPLNFFKVTVDAPPDVQAEYSAIITKAMNKRMKKSRAFLHNQRSKFAGVVLHGVGASMWWDSTSALPSFIGIQDLLIPTDTDLTLENMRYFSVRRPMSPGKLFKLAIGRKNVDPCWNIPVVKQILDKFKELNSNPHSYDWANSPEQMAELFKQNLSYYDSDSCPVIWMNDFFFREEGDSKKKPGWYRAITLDKDNSWVQELYKDGQPQFVYKPDRAFADSLDNIIQFQFGDGNNVPPFKYHSIRSLAYMLYELNWTMNRLNCQFTQHVFEQLMTWFRVSDPADRDRLSKIVLSPPFAIIPDGLSTVSNDERYKVDPGLVNLLQSQYRQKVTESSSSYTQDADTGTQKERTKYEVEAIMAQTSALMSSMLNLAYGQEYFTYLEICRRFAIKNSPDFMVKKFRAECLMKGVPEKFIDAERWDIQVEQVLGGGNKMLELAQSRELQMMRPKLNPSAQTEVDRIHITSLTDNPELAESLVPHAPKISDSVHDAELAFGTLMQGIPVSIKPGVNSTEQAETLLRLMAAVISRIKRTDGVGKPEDVIGLQAVAQAIGQHVQIIAENPDNKALVKEIGDAMGKLMNEVRAFAQRQSQSHQNQNQQPDPETQAKLQSMIAADRLKLQSKAQSHQQKLQQKAQSFKADQERKNLETVAGIQRDTGMALAEVRNSGIKNGNRVTAFDE